MKNYEKYLIKRSYPYYEENKNILPKFLMAKKLKTENINNIQSLINKINLTNEKGRECNNDIYSEGKSNSSFNSFYSSVNIFSDSETEENYYVIEFSNLLDL